jgi:hypothetical protein
LVELRLTQSKFNTYAHLHGASYSLLLTAKETPTGSFHCLTASALFSAFTVEAHMNHVGEAQLAYWSIVEPKLSWRQKLELVAQHLGITIDWGKEPYQTVARLFKFRDRLAHGKSSVEDVEIEMKTFDIPNPEWLNQFSKPEAVETARKQVKALIDEFADKAGMPSQAIATASVFVTGSSPPAGS